MIRANYTSILFLIFSIISFSCSYELDDSYINPIELPTDISPEVELLILSDEPFYLTTTTRLRPQIELVNPTELIGMEVSVDFEIIKELSQSTFFELNPADYGSGTHRLDITVLNTTASGSLASALDAESLTTTYTWQFIIDRTPPTQALNLTTSVVDGQLLLSWDAPEKLNFTRYVLSRFGRPDMRIDKSFTSTTDLSYIGGFGRYQLNIESDFFTVEGPEVKINYDVVDNYDVELLEDRTIEASWTTPVFYNSISKMELVFDYNPTNEVDVTNINDYTFPVSSRSYRFGRSDLLNLRITSLSNSTRQLSRTVARGENFPSYRELKLNAQNNSFYVISRVNSAGGVVLGSAFLYRIDADTEEVLAYFDPDNTFSTPFSGTLAVSENGRYLYWIFDQKLYRLDPMTLQVIDIYTANDLIPGEFFTSQLRVSNSNVISLNGGRFNINMNNLQQIWGQNAGLASPQHKFVLNYDAQSNGLNITELYDINGENLELKATIQRAGSNGELFIEDQDILIVAYLEKVMVYDLLNDVILHEIPVDNGGFLSSRCKLTHDLTTDLIMLQSRFECYIIDYQQGTILETKPVTTDRDRRDVVYRLYNGKAYASSGFKIDWRDW